MSKYIVYKDRAAQFRWRFVAGNGQTISDSGEGYVQKSDCLNGIRIMKTEGATAPVDDQTVASSASSYGRGW